MGKKFILFYFLNVLHHLFNHKLNLKIIHFPRFVQIPCVFIKFLFSLCGKIDNQIPSFPCVVANLQDLCDSQQNSLLYTTIRDSSHLFTF